MSSPTQEIEDNDEYDSNGYIRCKTPPESKQRLLPLVPKIAPSPENSYLSNEDDDDDDYDDDDDEWFGIGNVFAPMVSNQFGKKKIVKRDSSDDSSRSPSPKRQRPKFESDIHEDSSDDDNLGDNETVISEDQRITIKIKSSTWIIPDFSTSPLNTEGVIDSPVYWAGPLNEVQWRYRLLRYKQEKEVFYALYVNVLKPSEDVANVEIRPYLKGDRYRPYKLCKSSKFPKLQGHTFLGYMPKSRIRDEDYLYERFLPDDNMNLLFRINIQLKKLQNELYDDFTSLWRSKRLADFNLIVDGEEFPVHKTILAARSPVFEEMFDKEEAPVEHEIKNVNPESIEYVLRYLYTGKLKRLFKYLNDFSYIADKYQVSELKAICDKAKAS